MRRLLFCILIALIPSAVVYGGSEQDFIGKMLSHVNGKADTYSTSEYEHITVSPTMIKSVLKMIGSNTKLLSEVDANKQEQLKGLLENVKSLRVLTVSKEAAKYMTLTQKLFNKNKHVYKEYAVEQLGEDKQIWTRQSGKSVIEIVMIEENPKGDDTLQIVDLTGNFGDNFFNMLMKMR